MRLLDVDISVAIVRRYEKSHTPDEIKQYATGGRDVELVVFGMASFEGVFPYVMPAVRHV